MKMVWLELELKRLFLVTVGTVIFVLGLILFVVPTQLVPGGLTGFASLTQTLLGHIGISVNLGLIVVLFNVPVMILGLRGISRTFIYYSIYSIVLQGLLIGLFETQTPFFGSDILAATIFGGLSVGLGAAIALKAGASLGGIDVIAQVLALKLQISIGYVGIVANGIILGTALLMFEPQIALYTLVMFVVANMLVDRLHTAYKRVRLDIVTAHGETVRDALLSRFIRGITILEGTGAYTGAAKQILWIVTQTHEVYDLKKTVLDVDPDAFITMTPIRHLSGKFHKVILK